MVATSFLVNLNTLDIFQNLSKVKIIPFFRLFSQSGLHVFKL